MDHKELRDKHRRIRDDLKASIGVRKSWQDAMADKLTHYFGSVSFLALNATFFFAWISYNSGYFGNEPFDPYPFIFLTMVVSLEAIFLAIIVLITQNRQSHLADVREQIDVEIDVRAEKEITKTLEVLELVAEKLDIPLQKDKELQRMKHQTNISEIKQKIESETP